MRWKKWTLLDREKDERVDLVQAEAVAYVLEGCAKGDYTPSELDAMATDLRELILLKAPERKAR